MIQILQFLDKHIQQIEINPQIEMIELKKDTIPLKNDNNHIKIQRFAHHIEMIHQIQELNDF